MHSIEKKVKKEIKKAKRDAELEDAFKKLDDIQQSKLHVQISEQSGSKLDRHPKEKRSEIRILDEDEEKSGAEFASKDDKNVINEDK